MKRKYLNKAIKIFLTLIGWKNNTVTRMRVNPREARVIVLCLKPCYVGAESQESRYYSILNMIGSMSLWAK